MNETNVKHGYTSIYRDAIAKALAQHWGLPGAEFLNYVSFGGGICQVMHSGILYTSKNTIFC